jgi:putative restriction endonuclease
MRGYIAKTDYDWFRFLRAIEPPVDEVNFWRPGSDTGFKALQPGGASLFQAEGSA